MRFLFPSGFPRRLAVLAAFVVALGVAWWAWKEEAISLWRQEEAKMACDLDRLKRRNRELREKTAKDRAAKNTPQILVRIEEIMAGIRSLPLQRPVAYRVMSRRMLRDSIVARMRAQYSGDDLQNYQTALVRMRLLPDGINLSGMISELLSEQIAAFYDTESHELCTFDGLSLQRNVERMIVAHEVVHALQDQNFNLGALPLKRKDNDDAALAAAALVEGDANYHMGVYLRTHFRVGELLGDLRFVFSQQTNKLLSAPAFLRETLLFPYQEGRSFVAELHARGGVEAINRAFVQPPQSTEQVLHPEKYLAGNDPPKPVLVNLKPGSGWRWIHENVVGELGVRAYLTPLLDLDRASRVASGWGGDRYVLYEVSEPSGGWVLVWKTIWDTPGDAREFFNAMEVVFRDRFRGPETGTPALAKDSVAAALFYSFASQKQALILRGDTVILLDAPNNTILRTVMASVVSGASPDPKAKMP
ncbi:MAG: hypothetical protein ACOYMV_00140 [Verrucomicrobiia bacterium]